jgi:hypothetical protein
METSVQYITDKKGNKLSVLVPYKKWERLNNDYNMLRRKINILNDINNSLNEIKIAKKEGRELQSLSEFLDESQN